MGLNPVEAKILSGFFSATAKIAGYLQRFSPCLRDQLDCHQRLSVSDHLLDDKIKMHGLTFQDSKLIGSTTVG